MALSDFFRTKPAAAATTAVKNDGTSKPGAAAKPGAMQDTTTGDFAAAGDPTKNTDGSSKNPLDSFAGMYDNKDMAEGDKPPAFALDPKSLEAAAASLKFSSHVTPELAQKLQSGDPVAIAEAFDALGRQVYKTSMSHQSTLTDKFVDARLSHDRKSLGQSVHSVLTANKLAQLAENNPVLKEGIQQIGDKISSKYPDATPDWIAEQTKNYFVNMAKQLDPNLDATKVAKEKAQAEDIDWADWINAGSKN